MTVEPGTVSSGTLREQDLVPAFLDVLDTEAPDVAAKLRADNADTLAFLAADPDALLFDPDDPESMKRLDAQGWLMTELFDALDALSPEGLYFGAHPGDGADFGFWAEDDAF